MQVSLSLLSAVSYSYPHPIGPVQYTIPGWLFKMLRNTQYVWNNFFFLNHAKPQLRKTRSTVVHDEFLFGWLEACQWMRWNLGMLSECFFSSVHSTWVITINCIDSDWKTISSFLHDKNKNKTPRMHYSKHPIICTVWQPSHCPSSRFLTWMWDCR